MEENPADLEELNRRLAELAWEKSFLQLMVNLFNEIIPVSGMEALTGSILQGLLNVIGGTGLCLYCRYDGALHFTDMGGHHAVLEEISDPGVEEVFRTGKPRETVSGFDQTMMLSAVTDRALTWFYPLNLSGETFGVVKIENIPLTMQSFGAHLATLFTYIAMALQNEIRSRDRLKKAYDELAAENLQRRRVEEELRHQKDLLEIRVAERTAELERLNEALREGSEAYQAILNSSSAGFWHADGEGRILDVNRRYEELSGYSRNELLAMTIPDLEALESPDETMAHIREMEHRGYGWFESRHRRKDGSLWDVEVSCSFPPSRRGDFYVFIQDISPRKKAEEERLRMEKLQSLGVLAGGIAHDFNNILTGILGNLSLARMYLEADHRASRPLKAAEEASGRAGVLARQLLTFARGGAPVKRVISLKDPLEQAFGLALGGSNVKGVLELDPDLNLTEADEGQLGQAFNNLVLNARQAMTGGGVLTIRGENCRVEESEPPGLPPGDYLKLVFEDRGCGIPEADLGRIFDPCFTTRPGGRGLGLPSVQSIVNRHGGAVSVASRVGEGTAVTIYLPAVQREKPRDGRPPEASRENRVEDNADKAQTILVMDDEELIRNLVQHILEHAGYRTVTCEDGDSAVRLYREARERGEPFAAVITDLTVPGGMGGVEAAGKILSLDPGARLIVSSGYCEDPVMADPGAYGFKGAVGKPYRIDDLKQVLEAVIARRGD